MAAPIRIHVASHTQADQVWKALLQLEDFNEIELHLDGHGYLYTVTRDAEGLQSTHRGGLLAHSIQQAALAAP
jgi:hypothetical protein